MNIRNESMGDSNEFEKENVPLSDRIRVFKSSQFDPDAYIASKCETMSEKEIRHLSAYLKDLKKASAEEMRKSVYANYSAFIRTAKEISALEGQLLSMRNLLSAQAAVIHGLADGVHVNSLSPGPQGLSEEGNSDDHNPELTKIEAWLGEFLETLEVLLAEKRVDEALAALDEGERVVDDANERKVLTPTALISLQDAIAHNRQKLANQLAEAACQPSTRDSELRAVVIALKMLGDGPRAHSLLLKAHRQKLQFNIQNLRPATAANGGAYSASLSQLVFSTIAQASSDSLVVFGEETSYTSELVTWAVKETEQLAMLAKRHCLASSAASGNLRAATECVQVCSVHCALLEDRGLALSPVLLKYFKPFIVEALTTNLRRIEQTTAALAASDDWSLTYPPGDHHVLALGGISASQPKLTSSAHRFISMVQELFEETDPLETLQLVPTTLEGVVQVFNTYVSAMINAFPGSMDEANQEGTGTVIVKEATTESQQLALLVNALVLADDLIPRAISKVYINQTNKNEELGKRDIDKQNRRKRLQRSVDRLRDTFCRQHALELIFSEEGDIRLTPHMYLSMDNYAEEPEWFPSPIFQELFAKLTRIASFASEMFVGRERFATVLLMRLTETVILWLSDDQTFWEEIEQGPKPLGPFGLQQFYLDMEFVMLFASQGRYLSRNLQQVAKNVIARAIDAVAASGLDPYNSLPEDDWFAEVAQIAIKVLMGKANFATMEREPVSPTASVSAMSVSSNFTQFSM